MFWTTFALAGIALGASGSLVVHPPLFVLPGFAAVAGMASIAISVAPRRRRRARTRPVLAICPLD
jgi:hypothetical protein